MKRDVFGFGIEKRNDQVGASILIIDDEFAYRQLLKETLSERYFILEAGDGVAGLTVALHEHPDLILLDIVMPRMDGITLLKKLREDAWGKDAHVIIMTNFSADDVVLSHLAIDNPPACFVKSDSTLSQVLERVKAALGAKNR